ncbi:hypothetical protein IIB79_11670 [candidate division KSB1 bacterium]|nr:hypothetical protein [candidate division KSB1 bacterium]
MRRKRQSEQWFPEVQDVRIEDGKVVGTKDGEAVIFLPVAIVRNPSSESADTRFIPLVDGQKVTLRRPVSGENLDKIKGYEEVYTVQAQRNIEDGSVSVHTIKMKLVGADQEYTLATLASGSGYREYKGSEGDIVYRDPAGNEISQDGYVEGVVNEAQKLAQKRLEDQYKDLERQLDSGKITYLIYEQQTSLWEQWSGYGYVPGTDDDTHDRKILVRNRYTGEIKSVHLDKLVVSHPKKERVLSLSRTEHLRRVRQANTHLFAILFM